VSGTVAARQRVAHDSLVPATSTATALERRLAEALEQQAATSEILRIISSSPSDLQPVFEAILLRAIGLCEGNAAVLWRFDGSHLEVAAHKNASAAGFAYLKEHPLVPGPYNPTPRAALERRIIHELDVFANPEYRPLVPRGTAGTQQGSTVIAVPLLRGDELLGVITIWRFQKKPFTENQVALLDTFASQAVIAIENVRLFNETKEALEQQTATSEILRVISSTQTDLGPVFDAIVRAAVRLSVADYSVAARFDGEMLHPLAFHGFSPKALEFAKRTFPMAPSRVNMLGRCALTREVVVVADMLADPNYAHDYAMVGGWRSGVAVPMLRDGRLLGVIGVSRNTTGAFPDHVVQLLQTFANQAVIAIENVRLFTELQASTRELTRSVGELKALGEVGQAVSSTLDLEIVLSTIVSRATQLAGMDGGAIFEYDEAGEVFRLHTTDRLSEELVAALGAAPIPRGEGAIGGLALTGEPVQIRDIADEGSYQSRVREILIRLGYRSLLAVPLLREDRLLGGLVVNRKSSGEFSPQVIDLLRTFATQSALAIQNARLFREIEAKGRELEAASRHKSEFLANMSHELRTPLNAIIGFSEVLYERMFGEINEKQTEYVGDILESGRHLLSLINDILDLSKIEAGRMELELNDFDLPSTIENTLILVRERAVRRGIELRRTIDEHLGKVRADERKVKQVLLNLLSNALKFTPEGGRIDVRAAVRDGTAEISVTDTGVGIAPEDQAAVFEEFRQVGTASKKVEGTGLGLAISRKFIELHGGSIWVKSQLGAGSTFAFTLPLQ
jgi:signal transduction histidine kinase